MLQDLKSVTMDNVKAEKPIHLHKYYETYRLTYLSTAPFLDNEQLCEYLKVKLNTLDHWCCQGKIAYSMPSNKRFFSREDINTYLNNNRKEAINGH